MSKIEQLAKTCHEVNKAYCESIGDSSQPSWEDAPDWQKKSAINGVHFHLGNPEAGDSASHDSWMAEKIADGWVYGKVKDPVAKTHHCIVPFDELPPNQQAKDKLFVSIIDANRESFAPPADSIQTLGEKLVRTEFNPSKEGLIDQLKQKTAELINICDKLGYDGFDLRNSNIAITHYETACMYAVKSATSKM